MDKSNSSNNVGNRIKSIRESKGLTIEQTAENAGVDIEVMKRIEESQALPSLAPLIKIARALGVRLGTFLDDYGELGPVVTRAEEISKGIDFNNSATDVTKRHMEYHPLSQSKADRHMECFQIDVEPSNDTDFIVSSHEGEEFIYVLDGELEITYGKQNYVLKKGDSIYYDSIVSHHVHAFKNSTAKILAVIYMPL